MGKESSGNVGRFAWGIIGLMLCASAGSAFGQIDHAALLTMVGWDSQEDCVACHSDQVSDLMNSVHYQWRSENPLVEFPGGGAHGMIDRACGLVGSNALINYDEQCGRCHVGDTLPFPGPDGQFTAEQKSGLDCLICHAAEGMYDTNNDGVSEVGELADDKPRVFDEAEGREVWHKEQRLAAALSVGGPVSNDACLRCHEHGQADYHYKRGTPFTPETDVHAAADMLCTDCHKTKHHKIARGSRVTDMFAWERQDVEVSCDASDCHGPAPHTKIPMLNAHTDKIGCETCHIPEVAGAQRRVWTSTMGVMEGPESNVPVYDEASGKWLPYTKYDEGLVSPSYRWFAGGASMLAEPIANPGAFDMQPATSQTPGAKILPFRKFVSGQPMDGMGIIQMPNFDANFTMGAALRQMAPSLIRAGFMRDTGMTAAEEAMMDQFPNMLLFDRADYFATGDIVAAVSIGMAKQGAFMMGQDASQMSRGDLIAMGSTMWSGVVAGLDLPDNPYAPGYVADQDMTTVTGSFITVSHAVKLEGALMCNDCHAENGRLDFAALGYDAGQQESLKSLEGIDHSLLIGDTYDGPQECEGCHEGTEHKIQQGVHYKFESELPEGYQLNDDGTPVSHTRSGKLWKLCGFPTTVPQFNWLGALADDSATPHVDKPGGCAKCHIGTGKKPYTAVGKDELQASEKGNVDCLVCHADNYTRKFYIAKEGGETKLNALGSPVVMVAPQADGVMDWSVYTEAAGSVGKTSSKTCNRCHAAAGGGKLEVDGAFTSFKRGSVYAPGHDVHATAGLDCADCHYAGDHKFKRPVNNDLSAHDVIVEGQMCQSCHDEKPHANPMYNMHLDKIACTTCHATAAKAATYKDFSVTNGPDSWGLYKPGMEFTAPAPIVYRWFNGTVGSEITARGDRNDGMIYPYRTVDFLQPVDADNNPVPVKWGVFFKTGDMAAAAAKGRDLYSKMVYSPANADTYGIPPVPGEFDHYNVGHNGGFSVSHGITRDGALTCSDCHATDGKLDFEKLGYTPSEQEKLKDLSGIDHSAFIGEEYTGPSQCESCHPGKTKHIQAGVHYKFESDLPEGYQFNDDGTPVSHTKSGKLWKLCGFPTTVPQFNWLGALKDDPATPHVDKPGGCAKCHIGTGKKPFTAVGKDEVQESEKDNVDCLICHADQYSRKFYVAKAGGEVKKNALGSPVVMIAPEEDGVMDWSIYTDAAKTVGLSSAKTCNRCHAAAGGGKLEVDGAFTSFKRGSVYAADHDVHATAGLACADCHYAGDHKFKRPVNNDLSAHDMVFEGEMCQSCHDEEPHSDSMYNEHLDKIACTTCHATAAKAATYKDFSVAIAPDPADPLGLWKPGMEFTAPAPIVYRWFNGTVGSEITARGDRSDGKIYPYRTVDFNQPVDAAGKPVPVKWGVFFKTGDMVKATVTGRNLYSQMVYSPENAATYGIPEVPGEFAGYAQGHNGGFSVSHGITKTGALTCADCHTTNGKLDFEALGYSPEDQQKLANPAEIHADIEEYKGPETCVKCHTKQAKDMFGSVHYQWDGPTPNVTNIAGNAGKGNDSFNTYCGAVNSSRRIVCWKCHVGNGKVVTKEEDGEQLNNIDCLMCHQDAYKRKPSPTIPVGDFDKSFLVDLGDFAQLALAWQSEDPADALDLTYDDRLDVFDLAVFSDHWLERGGGVKLTHTDFEGTTRTWTLPYEGGSGNLTLVPDAAKMGEVTPLQAAQTVHMPTRQSCLQCHAVAGGGNGLKRGDLAMAAVNAPVEMDVHLSAEGANLSCQACHDTEDHRMLGRGLDLRVNDRPEKMVCDNGECHTDAPHESDRLNKHTARVACQTCHISTYAKLAPTETHRDWLDPHWVQGVYSGQGGYKPREHTASDLTPSYAWYDGTSNVYKLGQVPDKRPDGAYETASPNGSVSSADAKIYPMKEHTTNAAMHTATGQLIPYATTTFFFTGQFEDAVADGLAERGLSGDWTVETLHAFQTLNHGVEPKEDALVCGECHTSLGEGPTRMDLSKLGYTVESDSCAKCHSGDEGGIPASDGFIPMHQRHALPNINCVMCHSFSR